MATLAEGLDISKETLASKLVCYASDGASVNIGSRNGIALQLKMEHAPFIESIWCMAHIAQVGPRHLFVMAL